MINAHITQNGKTATITLPMDYFQLHDAVRTAGITEYPKHIRLSDEDGDDIRVRLESDSEMGQNLLRLFMKTDTLATANEVTQALDKTIEDIRDDLEQNICNEQYPTIESLYMDIRTMTEDAGPVKLAFYCPLVGNINEGDYGDMYTVGESFLADHEDEIEEALEAYQPLSDGDMAQYMDDHPGVKAKLVSAVWSVEVIGGELYGKIQCHLRESLTEEECAALKEEITGQNSDGFGEGFEQREIHTEDGDLYVSFWNSDDDYFVCTEDELEHFITPKYDTTMGWM